MNFLRITTGFFLLVFLFSCSGQKDKFAKNWKATEVSFNGGPSMKTDGLVAIEFRFKSDGSFEYVEDGKSETGTWTLSDDGKEITLKFADREVKQKIVKQEDKMLVLDYSDHGMQRGIILMTE